MATRKGIWMKNNGFTLIEVLISMSIVAILVLIVAGSLRIGISSVEKGERKFDELERIRASAGVIDSQIQSWLPLTYEEDEKKRFFFTGERESIVFPANHSIWDGRQGYVMVRYQAVISDSGMVDLVASENLVGKSSTSRVTLLSGLDEIYFAYLYEDEETGAEEWLESWTDYEVMPQMVRIVIKGGTRVNVFTIPVRTARSLKMKTRSPRRKKRLR